MEINAITLKVLERLAEAEGVVSVADILGELRISKRILVYNLDKLNSFLTHAGFAPVVMNEDTLYPEPGGTAPVSAVLHLPELRRRYIFLPLERRALIFMRIGLQKQPVTLTEIYHSLHVSKNTVVNDMLYVRNYAESKGISIGNTLVRGYYLDGDEVMCRRALFESYIMIENTVIRSLINAWFFENIAETEGVSPVAELLTEELGRSSTVRHLKLQYTSLRELVFYILLMKCRAEKGCGGTEKQVVLTTEEYKMAGRLIDEIRTVQIPKEEQNYLAMLLLSIRKENIGIIEQKRGIDFRQYASRLVECFEAYAYVKFEDKSKLIRQLLVHICPMYYRIIYNIRVSNRYSENIQQQFPEYYRITGIVVRSVSDAYGFTVPDEEVAYICMYFVSFMTRQKMQKGQHRASILIVCGAGIGTSLFLRNQLTDLIGHEYKIETLGYQQLEETELSGYDLILSTVKLPFIKANTIYVNALLSEKDKENILNWSCANGEPGEMIRLDELLRLIEKHATVNNRAELKRALRRYFREPADAGPAESSALRLTDVLDASMIRICTRQQTDAEALQTACAPMISAGIVPQEYPDRIFGIIEKRGLYFEIVPGILLAHAEPGEQIRKVGVSLALFPEGVSLRWESKEPIRVIFVLASPDNKSHFFVLQDLIRCIQNTWFVQQLKTGRFADTAEIEELIQTTVFEK